MASNSLCWFMDAYLAIPSNYDTKFMDPYLLAILRNCDKLHLFNLCQKQLLQAICNDASQADLSVHLDSTLLKITDGSNEEEGDLAEFTWKERENEKVRLGPESRDMLALGRVYEKALGEARHNTRIEKFLVMELEKDGKLIDYLSLNLPEVRRLKIACWAATCNFVHMVMALIHCRDEGGRGFFYRVLTIAVEFGYVELVKRLTDREEFDVNRGRRIVDFDIYLREVGKPIQRKVYETDCLYYYAFSDRLSPLNLAAKLGNLQIVNIFLQRQGVYRTLLPEGYWALYWAATMGHAEVVDTILLNKNVNVAVLMTVEKSLIEHRLSYGFATSFPWLGGSNIWPFCRVSLTPLQMALLYGHISVVKLLRKRLEATIEQETRVMVSTEVARVEIVKILMHIPEVEEDVKRLEGEMQTQVSEANAIFLVAALIGGVTFTSCVQPPLGSSPIYGSANPNVAAPIPAPSFASVEGHPLMVSFYFSNAISLVFAISALMTGCAVARPPQSHEYIGVTVPFLREFLYLAYTLLYISLYYFLFTFLIAAKMVLPPLRLNSVMHFILSLIVCGLMIMTAFLLPKNLLDRYMKNRPLFYCSMFAALTNLIFYYFLWV